MLPAIMLAAIVASQGGAADLPERLVRALRARPLSFHCRQEETPPKIVTVSCTPICTSPPSIFSVRELVALDVSPKMAQQLSTFDAQQYDDWHRYCDRRTS
jgi:hypothetical protein